MKRDNQPDVSQTNTTAPNSSTRNTEADFNSSDIGSEKNKYSDNTDKEKNSDWFRNKYKYTSPFEGTQFGHKREGDIEFYNFINKSFDFSYPDGTKISLKFLEKIINKNDKTIYCINTNL